MVSRTQAIKNFLQAKTRSDLAQLYIAGMEVQVNVARDHGEKEKGEYKGREFVVWTDGIERWKPFRIPYNAMKKAEYTDIPMSFSLDKHAEGIGMTGWNWKEEKSFWVAYDFDTIVGHSDKHNKKLSDAELKYIVQLVTDIPWVTVRTSTGGSGLHLYVFVDYVITINHTEHAALARSILNMLSALTGYEFSTKVDTCGGNMWVWHRKLKDEGLKLIKQGIILTDIPKDWRNHVNVVSSKSTRVALQEIKEPDAFDQLTGQRAKMPLDDHHKQLIKYLQDNKCFWWWDNDLWMLVTHTTHLKQAHDALQFMGRFETNATGSDQGHDHNCFAYPLRNGAWVVRRYTQRTGEASTWQIDSKGWTRCFYNRKNDFGTTCLIHNGVEHSNGNFYFVSVSQMIAVLKDLTLPTELPFDKCPDDRECTLGLMKKDNTKMIATIVSKMKEQQRMRDSNMIVEVEPNTSTAGWILEKRKHWEKVFILQASDESEKNENYDDLVRHVTSETNEDRGWLIKGTEWREEPLSHVHHALTSQGFNTKDKSDIIGTQIIKAWKLVNKPFQPEYPGNREWNRSAAQIAFAPSAYFDPSNFPTWTEMLEHCGSGLNLAISNHEWCKKHDILTGGDYLRLWIASVLKEPYKSLPYLFFYGEQETGKSSFHVALSYLLTRGYMRADTALGNTTFNAEILNALICVIEETDLRTSKLALNKIKDWVTSPEILIHAKGYTPYLSRNATHWIQCSNEHQSCPVFPGDTRITMIHVPKLIKMLSPLELKNKLIAEAPDFLGYVLKMEIPETSDRLNIPVIDTHDKKYLEGQNKSAMELFIESQCHYVKGSSLLFSEFYDKFLQFVDHEEARNWSKIAVTRAIPLQFPRGKLTDNNQTHIGNMSFGHKEDFEFEYYNDGGQILRLLPLTNKS